MPHRQDLQQHVPNDRPADRQHALVLSRKCPPPREPHRQRQIFIRQPPKILRQRRLLRQFPRHTRDGILHPREFCKRRSIHTPILRLSLNPRLPCFSRRPRRREHCRRVKFKLRQKARLVLLISFHYPLRPFSPASPHCQH